MRTYTPLILLFAVLFGSVIVNALATPQVFDPIADLNIADPNIADPNIAAKDAALEAEIAKLRGLTRVSKLPLDSTYTFTQVVFDPITNITSSITLHRTVRELLAPLTPSASTVSKRNDPEFGAVCETSGGSPQAIDVIKALVDVNRAQRQRCCQIMPFSTSHCYTMQNHGTASLGICGAWMRCVPCENMYDFIMILVDLCKVRGRDGTMLVGGRFVLGAFGPAPPWGGELTVFHS
ncbi:uncharacterized protein H6S33_006566 [Morchella sextelata]|uniref:uncharacterized protein n=1 Tax=Morchella sextelata TaxID=1174677 RepID=UPI001D04A2CF|nr:uncharacterized protein H6S33_006566 [Morchella sextelata]KAH0604898.1 hypothetical protein H6S33_006566 [Morchella sextelata]